MKDAQSYDWWNRFWQLYATSFVAPLQANGLLRNFVTNPNVTGLYAEAWVRSMARTMLPHFRISTGAVVRPSDQLKTKLQSIPQCDLIIWDPSELPPLFEQGDFAVVPMHSVHGIIEIKRTCPNSDDLIAQLEVRRGLLRTHCMKNLLGVVVESRKQLFVDRPTPDWLEESKWLSECPLVSLFSHKMKPRQDDIMAFIYFLAQVAGHKELMS